VSIESKHIYDLIFWGRKAFLGFSFWGCPSILLFALVTSNLKCQKSSIFWVHQKKFSKKKNAQCMQKQNRVLFLGCPSMFLFALVKSNLKRQKKVQCFFAHQKKFSKKKMPIEWKSKVENNLSQKL